MSQPRRFNVYLHDSIHGEPIVERYWATAFTKEEAMEKVKARLRAELEKKFKSIQCDTNEEIEARQKKALQDLLLAVRTGMLR